MSIGVQAQGVSGVALDHDTITLVAGTDTTLHVEIIPSTELNKLVAWGTTNESIASIDTTSVTEEENLKCVVKGVNAGVVKISVKHVGSGYTDTCVINVIRLAESVQLNENAMTVTLGRDSILIAFISPDGVSNDSMIWVSRDSSIVDILSTINNRYDSVCNIKALKLGTVFIVGETVDGGFKDSCAVTVVAAQIESFSLTSDSIDLIVGADTTITAQIRPLEGTVKTVSWGTNDIYDKIISRSAGYDTTITITAKGVGRAIVFAEASGGEKDTCVITVRGDVEEISLNKDSLELILNADTIILSATITPFFVINDSIEWTSSDSTIVDITSPESIKNDTICKIKGLRPGTAIIRAKTFDGEFRDSCVVTVIVPVDSIVIRSSLMVIDFDERVHMDLKDDSVAVLIAKVYPDTATYKSLSWKNFDSYLSIIDSVPTIHNDTICYIKALFSGIDTVTVTSDDGIESRFCYIVIAPREVDSVKINKSPEVVNDTIPMLTNTSFELVTTVFPFNATNDTLKIESSDPKVAKIDSTSTSVSIRALKVGEAIVFVTPMDGNNGKKDSVIVKVQSVPVSGVSLSADTIRLYEQNKATLIATVLPVNVTNDTLIWFTSDNSVIRIEPPTSDDSITFTALKADTAFIYAVSKENSTIKDSCVVIVKEQYVFLEADTSTVDGIIKLSLVIPNGISFNGASFELRLPRGFGLTREGDGYRTSLSSDAKILTELQIDKLTDSTFFFSITPKILTTSNSMLRAGTPSRMMDIYYTIFDVTLKADSIYEAKFNNISILNDAAIVIEDCVVKIKIFNDPTANDIFNDSGDINAYYVDGLLYVNSDKDETVYVYSLNGALLFMKDKTEGQAVFDIKTQEKILIVKGSSGWAGKVNNR